MTGAGPDALFERERELSRVRALVEEVAAGGSGVLVLEGPTGIGKTALLARGREIAGSAGLRVLSARATELERDHAFGVVRQWFEPLLASAPPEERARLLDGAAGLAAPAVLPGAEPSAGEEAGRPVLHGLYWLTVNLAASGPVLLVVDDVQWADEASLRLLNFVVLRLEGTGAGLLAACRPPVVADEEVLLSRLLADPRTEALALAPLGEAGAGALLARAGGAEPAGEFVRACQEATGGNPFFLTELARRLAGAGVAPTAENAGEVASAVPRTVSRAVLARLAPETLAFAQVLAVLDAPAEPGIAAELAGLSGAEADAAARELERAGLLADDGRLELAHAIVADAALASLAAGERARLHRAAARLLGERGAPPDRLAGHLIAAEPAADPAVVEILRRAARRAIDRGAPDVASRALERALAEPPEEELRAEVLADLGRAERHGGTGEDTRRATGHLTEAHGLARDPVTRGQILRDLAWTTGPMDEKGHRALAPLLDRSIAELGDADPELALELESARLSGLFLIPGGAQEFGERLERLGPLDGSSPTDGLLLSFVARHHMTAGGPASVVADAAERAMANPATLEAEGPDSVWLINVGIALALADRLDPADRLLAQALDLARRRGSVTGFAVVSGLRSRVFLRRGDLRAAEAEARAALAGGLAAGWYNPVPVGRLMEALVAQGRTAEAQAVYDELEFGESIPEERPAVVIVIARGLLRLQRGELDAALADFEDARRRLEIHQPRNAVGLDVSLHIATVRHALGDEAGARAEAAAALEVAERWATPGAVGEALRVAGIVRGGEEGLEVLGRAAAELERSPATLEHARALVDHGAALRRSGTRAAARDPLRRGLELADAAGAAPLAERARDELAASGVRVARADRDRLTPSEQRVARMAADGLSNPQIAQALFVTVKTVEGHLGNTYRKLQISGRGELALALSAAP